MPDNFQKVQPGQSLKIPAATFNAFLDAARDLRSRQHSRQSQSQPIARPSGIVKVKNGSGDDRHRFEILGIERPIFTPTDNLTTFQNEVLLVGVMPDGQNHPGRFCVLLEPLKADAIGLAVIAGVCPVRIDVQDESDRLAEVQDGDATQLKSVGSGSATILWKEPGTGENKWAVIRLGDSQPVIRKAEMIDTLQQGDTCPAQAWLLKYEHEEWQRTDQQIALYGDQGFRGVAFGRTSAVDAGDKIDVSYSHEARQWYGVVGGWYFHGNVVADIAAGDQGEVTLNVGAGADEREITVPAYSPYAAVKQDDFVSVSWNTFSRHWDIGRFEDLELGCGLAREEDPNSPDYRRLQIDPQAIAGDGLTAGRDPDSCTLSVNAGCGLSLSGGVLAVDATLLAGSGLIPSGPCQLSALPPPLAEGLEYDPTGRIRVRAGDGLAFGPDGRLRINPGDGLMIGPGGKLQLNLGKGFKIKDGKLAIDDTVDPTKTQSSYPINDVDLSLDGCSLKATYSYSQIDHQFNSGGMGVGIQVNNELGSVSQTIDLCDCDCQDGDPPLSDSIPGEMMALGEFPESDWDMLLSQGGELNWPVA